MPDHPQIDPEILALAVEELTRFTEILPPGCRASLLPDCFYALDIADAWTGAEEPAPFVRREVRERVLADLAAPSNPLASRLVHDEAVAIATEVLERRDRGATVDLNALAGYAAEALVCWGREETLAPGSTGGLWVHVRETLEALLDRDSAAVQDPADG